MNITLLLIEDDVEEATKIKNRINGFGNVEKEGQEYSFSVLHLLGQEQEEAIRGKTYQFYNGAVLEQIEGKKIEVKSVDPETKVGLLLDVVLTKEELDSKDKNFYPEVNMARKIYDEFHEHMPIYFLTSVPSFYTHSEQIMGINLSEQFIPKDALLKFKMKTMIDKFMDYYINWPQ